MVVTHKNRYFENCGDKNLKKSNKNSYNEIRKRKLDLREKKTKNQPILTRYKVFCCSF